MEIHYTNAHAWMKRFLEAGIAGLSDWPKSGRPRLYGADFDTAIVKATVARQKDLGLPFTNGSLPEVEKHLKQQPGLAGVAEPSANAPGMAVAEAPPDFLDVCCRLLRLLANPSDIQAMSGLTQGDSLPSAS